MTLTIEIKMDNAAFDEDGAGNGREYEVKQIFAQVTHGLFAIGKSRVSLRDSNGNRVGFAEIDEDNADA